MREKIAGYIQLQRLSGRGIVSSRRKGNCVHYRTADPCAPMIVSYGIDPAGDFMKCRQIGSSTGAKRRLG